MKRYLMAAVIALAAFTMASCEGTYTVTTRPERPLYERPISPGSNYVWIDGDWYYTGGQYRWREGYWGRARRNRVYVSGSWESRNNGWYWRRGRWQ